jgi:hypothetical protein
MYALSLTNQPRYTAIAYRFNVYAGPYFFAWLLEHKLVLLKRRIKDCLALYFADADWKHVGIVTLTERHS